MNFGGYPSIRLGLTLDSRANCSYSLIYLGLQPNMTPQWRTLTLSLAKPSRTTSSSKSWGGSGMGVVYCLMAGDSDGAKGLRSADRNEDYPVRDPLLVKPRIRSAAHITSQASEKPRPGSRAAR
jgi:hypothetical protein